MNDLIVTKDYEGLEKEDGVYKLEGSLVAEGCLLINLDSRLVVAGGIKAGGDIEAGLAITCKGSISFVLRLFAGTCTWRKITDEEKKITCSKIKGGTVEYGKVELLNRKE